MTKRDKIERFSQSGLALAEFWVGYIEWKKGIPDCKGSHSIRKYNANILQMHIQNKEVKNLKNEAEYATSPIKAVLVICKITILKEEGLNIEIFLEAQNILSI